MAHTAATGAWTQRDLDARLTLDDHLFDIGAAGLDDRRLTADHRVVAGHDGHGGDAVAPAIIEVVVAGIDRVDNGQKRYVIVALIGLIHAARAVRLNEAGQYHAAGSINHAVVARDGH